MCTSHKLLLVNRSMWYGSYLGIPALLLFDTSCARGRSRLDTGKNFFTVKHQNRLPMEEVVSLSLGVFRKSIDVALGNII